jgi:hypothetical protein
LQGERKVRASLVSVVLLLLACSPGPTYVLGSLPDQDEDSDEDAAVPEPCNDSDDCQSAGRRFCSDELDRCVECLYERHCRDDEFCGSRSGRCISESER